jgi:hypothetical protein
MDAKWGELVPVTGKAEDERTGLAILQLLAEAADSPPQSRWVHRRVAQLEFLDTRAVRWRISVDFSIPESAPSIDGGQHLLVPITRWRKSELVKLDFRDEQGTAIPLMTAEATSRLMAAALYRWAADILRREKAAEPGTMSGALSEIVSQPPDPDQQEKTADEKIKVLLDRVSNADPHIAGVLFADKGFRSKLYELSENFVVLASVANSPGTRRILKLAFESAVTFQHPHGWWRKVRQLFGWRDWRLEVMLGGRGGSGHLEVAAPTGVDIFKMVARPAVVTQPEPGARKSQKPLVIKTAGKTPHVAIRIPAGARRYRATIYLRVSLTGWLTASWSVSLVIFGLMTVSRVRLWTLFSKAAAPGEAGTAATLLLALLGVFASYLLQPGEHPLAARLLRAARGLITIDVAVVLVAVGSLLLHYGTHEPTRMWDSLTVISGLVAVLLTLSLLLPPWPWRKVTTQQAPHWESDARPAEEEIWQPPEGVPLQAPDGFSYGDENAWGAADQERLVEELTSVRRAAGFLPG